MDEWLNKMAEEALEAKRVTKKAMRKARDDTKLGANRLTKLKELKTQVKEVKMILQTSHISARTLRRWE